MTGVSFPTDIFVPDGMAEKAAMKRITHLGIGAHQDDLEFMAFRGILECYAREDKWFGGVTCTNGSGSSRTGAYAGWTDEQMVRTRRSEQRTAAVIGQYGVMIQLGLPSSVVRSPTDQTLKTELKRIISACQPDIVYTHNLADKHDSHIGVAVAALQAMRELPKKKQPKRVIGCEVWRNLDWLQDADKVVMDVSAYDNLATALNGVFYSQIGGGKRYDLATLGRRAANATFFESHRTDSSTQIIFGMDLTPIVADGATSILAYTLSQIEKFKRDVEVKLSKRLGVP